MAKTNFDTKKVRKATLKVVYDAFGRLGAYGQKVAKNSIKNAPKSNKTLDDDQIAIKGRYGRIASKPGKPPYSHRGNLKKSIVFAVDRVLDSVVIGPMQYKGHSDGAKALEYGDKVVKKTKINAPKPKGPPKPPTHGRERPKGKNGRPYRHFYSHKSHQDAVQSRRFRRWCKEQMQARKNIKVKVETIKVAERPFMAPAFEEAKKRLPEIFKESTNKFK